MGEKLFIVLELNFGLLEMMVQLQGLTLIYGMEINLHLI